MNIGVLALQGSVSEHLKMLASLGKRVNAVAVKTIDELASVDGLIIPGGESTTLRILLDEFNLYTPIKARIESGMPVWGTCAGMILLANRIDGERPYFSVLDIGVKRNAYGRQIDSFVAEGEFADMYIGMVFIRAPIITHTGESVTVLATVDDKPVAVRQGNILATAFHPEMVARDNRVHKYFMQMIDNQGE